MDSNTWKWANFQKQHKWKTFKKHNKRKQVSGPAERTLLAYDFLQTSVKHSVKADFLTGDRLLLLFTQLKHKAVTVYAGGYEFLHFLRGLP